MKLLVNDLEMYQYFYS